MCEGVWPNGKGVFWPRGDIEFNFPFTNLHPLPIFWFLPSLKLDPRVNPITTLGIKVKSISFYQVENQTQRSTLFEFKEYFQKLKSMGLRLRLKFSNCSFFKLTILNFMMPINSKYKVRSVLNFYVWQFLGQFLGWFWVLEFKENNANAIFWIVILKTFFLTMYIW
jgi:hypothetical protein